MASGAQRRHPPPPRQARRLDGRPRPEARTGSNLPRVVAFEKRIGGRLVTSAREEILWRIRRATRDVEDERPEDVPVERGYREEDDAPRDEIVKRFAQRTAEYEATIHRVSESDLLVAIAEALERRGVRRRSDRLRSRHRPDRHHRSRRR